MDDKTLRSIIAGELARSIGSAPGTTASSEIAEARDKALKYYFAEPFGNEITGRSQVVSSDVQTVVDQELASLMEIFFGGDKVCEAQPVGPEDVEGAKQATDYLDHIWNVDNDGYRIGQDWFKDALIQKVGFIRIEPERINETKRVTHTGLDQMALVSLLSKEGVEIVEFTEHPPNELGMAFYDVTTEETKDEIRIRVAGIAPEDAVVEPRAIDLDDCQFRGWRWRKTRWQLIEDGFDKDLVMKLPADQTAEASQERNTRFGDETVLPNGSKLQDLMEQVSGFTVYINVDYDDDGKAELRKVTVAGVNATEILENEELDDQPMVALCPRPVPHKLFGQSEAEVVMQEQLVKSTLYRQGLDNVYQINNNRVIINDRIDMADMLTNRVGGAIRADGTAAAAEAYSPMIPTPILDVVLAGLEYCDRQIEAKTGQSRMGAGIDPDSLNKQVAGTASGMNMIMTSAQKRLMLVARNFAEGGVKRAFRKILKLIIAHQDQPRMIRLRGKFVPMDPSKWNADMDVKVSVGLGYGSREQQAAMLSGLLMIQEKIVAMQGGVSGPILFAENIYHGVEQYIQKAVGYRNADLFVTDPGPKEQQAPPQPQKDPEMIKAEAQIAIQTNKAQHEAKNNDQEHQLKLVELQAEMQRDREKWQIEREKLLLELQVAREKAQIDVAKAGVDMQLKQAGQAQQIEFDREKHGMQMEQAKQKGDNEERKGKSNGVSINLGGEGNDLKGITDGLTEAVKALTAAASAPKRKGAKLVRDGKGKAVGMEDVY